MKPAHEKRFPIVFLLGLAALSAPFLLAEEQKALEPGQPAPPLGIERWVQPEGHAVSGWEDWQGKIVVLEFWATWCAPCVAAIPHWNELVEKFRDRPVVFVSVSNEEEDVVKEFLRATPIQGWVGLDTDRSMFDTYGVQGIPLTILVDTTGNVLALTRPEPLSEQALEDALAGNLEAVRAALPKPLSLEPLLLRRSEDSPPPLFEVLIRPSTAPVTSSVRLSANELVAQGLGLDQAIRLAYQVSDARLVLPDDLSNASYDFQVTVPPERQSSANEVLQEALATAFGLRARRETREADVLLLVAPQGRQPSLKEALPGPGMVQSWEGKIQARNVSPAQLANSLEYILDQPVLDETGITGNYAFELTWDAENPDSVFAAIREQLGLELRRATRSIEFLVIESTPAPKK
ncbi:MAG: TIGR03435 family protein [Terriglobia bacterium]